MAREFDDFWSREGFRASVSVKQVDIEILKKLGKSGCGREITKTLGVFLKNGEGAVGREVENIGFRLSGGGILGTEGGLEVLRGAEARKIARAIEHENRGPFGDCDTSRETTARKGDSLRLVGMAADSITNGGEDFLAAIFAGVRFEDVDWGVLRVTGFSEFSGGKDNFIIMEKRVLREGGLESFTIAHF